jgi:nitrate reductase assembly molybdenum cofactor insertion protein NarJ
VVATAGAKGVTTQVLHSTHIYICVCVSFLQLSPEVKQKKRGLVPWTGAGVQRFLQAFEDKGDYWEGILIYLQKLGDVLNKRQAQVNQDPSHLYESPR